MSEPSYIFGKTLTQHLDSLEVNDRYLELRIERFTQEFLTSEVTYDQLNYMLECIYSYLYQLDESQDLEFSLMNLQQCIFWLNNHENTY